MVAPGLSESRPAAPWLQLKDVETPFAPSVKAALKVLRGRYRTLAELAPALQRWATLSREAQKRRKRAEAVLRHARAVRLQTTKALGVSCFHCYPLHTLNPELT